MMAGNLDAASALSYDQMSLAWYAATIKVKLAAYVAAVNPIVPDDTANNRSVGNWIIPLYQLSTRLAAAPGQPSTFDFNTAVEYVARLCATAAAAQSQNRITNAQAVALLAAWNAQFGT